LRKTVCKDFIQNVLMYCKKNACLSSTHSCCVQIIAQSNPNNRNT
jgi:hypothetical protein